MTYNANVVMEQGGSVLAVKSGGSINVEAGGTIAGAGTIAITGNQTLTGALEAASVTVTAGGPFFLGTAQFISATSSSDPEGGNVSAAPGSIFLRVDGSMSNLYVNISVGTAGSVWKSASIYS
jgi:hypothetical protein